MSRCVRNSDEELRRLEREVAAGDPSAEIRLAVARERTDGAVTAVRAWINERLTEANAVGGGPMTSWGPRVYGVLGSGLVRDVVFRAAGHEVHGQRGEQPDPELPIRAWVAPHVDGPGQVMEELRADHLDATYALAVQDDGSVVLGIRAALGWTLHGTDTMEGHARYLDGPRLDKAWPGLDRALHEEHRLSETYPEDYGRQNATIHAARSIWLSWCHADDARPTWGGRGKPPVGARTRIADTAGVNRHMEGVVVPTRGIPLDGRGVPNLGMGHYHPVNWRKETPIRYDDGRLDVIRTVFLRPVPAPHDRIRISLAVIERWRLIERGENPAVPNPPRRVLLNDGAAIPVRICPVADEAHRTSKRAYAHVFCGPGPTVCVASAYFDLPREFRDGILAHELGHIFAGSEGDEPAADRAFLENTGVQIRYKDGRYGQCLQCLAPGDSRKLEGRFTFDFAGRRTGVGTEDDETEIEYVVSIRSEKSLDWDELLEAVGLDPALFGEPSQRGVGRRFDWTVSSLADAEEQAEAVRKILPSGMEVVAFAREFDREGVRELGWSA